MTIFSSPPYLAPFASVALCSSIRTVWGVFTGMLLTSGALLTGQRNLAATQVSEKRETGTDNLKTGFCLSVILHYRMTDKNLRKIGVYDKVCVGTAS